MHRRQLPLAFTCPRNFAEMPARNEGRERWCETCEKTVHDLSQHSEAEARALLRRRGERGSLCISYTHDPSGQVVFRRKQLDRVGVALASLALLLSSGCSGLMQFDQLVESDAALTLALAPEAGCTRKRSRDRTPVDQSARFELPEPEPQQPLTIWTGEMDEVKEAIFLQRPSGGYFRAHGGIRWSLLRINMLHDLLELSEQAPGV